MHNQPAFKSTQSFTISITEQNVDSSPALSTSQILQIVIAPCKVQDPQVQSQDILSKYNEIKQKYQKLSNHYKKLYQKYKQLQKTLQKTQHQHKQIIKNIQYQHLYQKNLLQKQISNTTQLSLKLDKELEDSIHSNKSKIIQIRNWKYRDSQIKKSAQLGLMLQVIPIIIKDKFQLQTDNLQIIADKCLNLYRIDPKYADILIYCFYKHFCKQIMQGGIQGTMEKTQNQIGVKMQKLEQRFPPFPQKSIKEVIDTDYFKPIQSHHQINLFLKTQFINEDDVFEQLQRINNQSSKATKYLTKLINKMIEKQVGCKETQSQICAKIPKYKTNKYKAYLRLIQKIFRQQLKHQKPNIWKDVEKTLLQHPTEKRSRKIAQIFNCIWKKYIQKIISQKRNNKQTIECHVYDFLRCKCCFNDQKQLRKAYDFFQKMSDTGRIFSIENKLKQNTKSIVVKLIITPKQVQTLVQPIVAEIQLLLKHDKYANQYNHAIFQMRRSPLGYLFGVILVLSQNTCENSLSMCIKDVKSHFNNFLKIVQGFQNINSSKDYIQKQFRKQIPSFTSF